jgi:rod shape-determining protein MreD
MEGVKLTIGLIIAVLLQWTLRNVAEPLAYIDFPLVVVVYAAIQRNSIRAILFGTIAGLAVDALSGGLLGSNGFTKTLIAFIVSEIARRVYLDNLLLRIPVIAGASILNSVVFFSLNRLLGQTPNIEPLLVGAYSLIATTIAGTVIYYFLEHMSAESVRPRGRRDVFGSRRQTRRRNPIRLAK